MFLQHWNSSRPNIHIWFLFCFFHNGWYVQHLCLLFDVNKEARKTGQANLCHGYHNSVPRRDVVSLFPLWTNELTSHRYLCSTNRHQRTMKIWQLFYRNSSRNIQAGHIHATVCQWLTFLQGVTKVSLQTLVLLHTLSNSSMLPFAFSNEWSSK